MWLMCGEAVVSIPFSDPAAQSPRLLVTTFGDSRAWSLAHSTLQGAWCCWYTCACKSWDFPPYPDDSGQRCGSGLTQLG